MQGYVYLNFLFFAQNIDCQYMGKDKKNVKKNSTENFHFLQLLKSCRCILHPGQVFVLNKVKPEDKWSCKRSPDLTALLAGELIMTLPHVKRITQHCYTKNIEDLGLMVTDKKILYVFHIVKYI